MHTQMDIRPFFSPPQKRLGTHSLIEVFLPKELRMESHMSQYSTKPNYKAMLYRYYGIFQTDSVVVSHNYNLRKVNHV